MGVPNCVLVPDARLLGSQGSCVYPARILCLRYHFQVRSGLGDLPDFLCQIQQAVLVAMSKPLRHIATVTFSSFYSIFWSCMTLFKLCPFCRGEQQEIR